MEAPETPERQAIGGEEETTEPAEEAGGAAINEGQAAAPLEERVEQEQGPVPVVEVGDGVLIVYNDEPNLQRTILISPTEHKPESGIIRVNKPLSQALLDAEINDEIEIEAGGGTRVVTVLDIEKGLEPATPEIDAELNEEGGTGEGCRGGG